MKQVVQYWLSQLCRSIPDATQAVVCLHSPDSGTHSPVAFWPEGSTAFPDYAAAVQAVLAENRNQLLNGRCIGENPGEPVDIVAHPLMVEGGLAGVVVIRMSGRAPARQQAVVQLVESAVFWLDGLIRHHGLTVQGQLAAMVELVASCLAQDRFRAAATGIMTELAARFSCSRVSIGFLRGRAVRPAAISNSAVFDRRTSLVRDLGEAMHESVDQQTSLVWPESGESPFLAVCHAVLAERHGIGAMLTVPFFSGGRAAGAILFERPADHPFTREEIVHLRQLAATIGPLLAVRSRNEQWLPQRVCSGVRRLAGRIFGPGYPVQKAMVAAAVFCLTILCVVRGDYRVTGVARLEAGTQRLVVTPQDGFVASAAVRPGDIVRGGDVLAALDDKDLQLERRKWSNQLGQLQTEYREALARHDRSKVSILQAEMRETEAQFNLIDEKLSRTRFIAPFDGLIVSGDLSQMLGSPVARGQVLFKIAPLDAYRVILQVDERDVAVVQKGQSGRLMLTGMPRRPLPFTVEKVTPVSIAEKGRNYFQVEGRLQAKTDLLRPGMEGSGRIAIDRRRLIWIWSHRIVDWLRLTFWDVRL